MLPDHAQQHRPTPALPGPLARLVDAARRRPLTCVFAAALAARLIAAWAMGRGFHFVDESEYVDAARRLIAGLGFEPSYPKEPAYATLLSLLLAALRQSVPLLRVAQSIIGACGSLLVFAVARRMFGPLPALLAAACYALDPLTVIAAALLYPETFAALALLATVLALLNAARDDRVGWSAAAGIWLALLIQLRAVGLVLVPIQIAWIAISLRDVRPRRRLLHAAALAATCALALAPWTYRNYAVHGRFVMVALSGSSNAPVRWRPEAKTRGLVASMIGRVTDDPAALAQRTAQQFGYFWELSPSRLLTDDPQWRAKSHQEDRRLPVEPSFSRSLRDQVSAISFSTELVFALVGLVVASRRRGRETAFLLAVMMAYAFGFALFFAKLRYRITVLPELFMFTGVGLATVRALARSRGEVAPRPAATNEKETSS